MIHQKIISKAHVFLFFSGLLFGYPTIQYKTILIITSLFIMWSIIFCKKYLDFFSGICWILPAIFPILISITIQASSLLSSALSLIMIISILCLFIIIISVYRFLWNIGNFISKFLYHYFQNDIIFFIGSYSVIYLFFVWLIFYSLNLFCFPGGIPILNPLIYFIDHDYCAKLVGFCGPYAGLHCLFLITSIPAWVFTMYYHTIIQYYKKMLLFTALITCISFFKDIENELHYHHKLNDFHIVQMVFPFCNEKEKTLINFFTQIESITQKSLDVPSYIILPESSISDPYFFEQCRIYNKNIYLYMVGGFLYEEGTLKNIIMYHDRGRVRIFKKRYMLPFNEHIPEWIKTTYRIFNHHYCSIPFMKTSNNIRPLWRFPNGVTAVPYICAELFLHEQIDDVFYQEPIIAFCNDRWCDQFFKDLLLQLAKYRAVLWSRIIFYISYSYAVCLCPKKSAFCVTFTNMIH